MSVVSYRSVSASGVLFAAAEIAYIKGHSGFQ